METTSRKAVANSKPLNRQQDRNNRFFKHAIDSISPRAQIIFAKGISRKGKQFVSYTYKLNDSVVTESFSMGGQRS